MVGGVSDDAHGDAVEPGLAALGDRVQEGLLVVRVLLELHVGLRAEPLPAALALPAAATRAVVVVGGSGRLARRLVGGWLGGGGALGGRGQRLAQRVEPGARAPVGGAAGGEAVARDRGRDRAGEAAGAVVGAVGAAAAAAAAGRVVGDARELLAPLELQHEARLVLEPVRDVHLQQVVELISRSLACNQLRRV